MSENENARMREIEKATHEAMEMFAADAPPEYKAKLIGTLLAVVDALFAIRDGNPWRDIEDPRDIARQLLRETGIGD